MDLTYKLFKERSDTDPKSTEYIKGVLSDHYIYLSEGLMRRIDKSLNSFIPKIFYEVVPLVDEKSFGVEVKVYDKNVANIVKEFLVSLKVDISNMSLYGSLEDGDRD